jgi:hypothetical protein
MTEPLSLWDRERARRRAVAMRRQMLSAGLAPVVLLVVLGALALLVETLS